MRHVSQARLAPLMALLIVGAAACGGTTAPAPSGSSAAAQVPASVAAKPASAPAQSAAASASAKPAASGVAKPAASGAAAAGPNPATLDQLIAGAKKETALKASWSTTSFGGPQGIADLMDQVNKKYGLNVKATFTPGIDMQSMIGKIIQEAAAGQPATSDVYMGNAQAALEALDKKAFIQYDWKSLISRPVPADPSANFDPYGPAGSLGFASDVTGVEYNTELVKGDAIPHTMNDLLKPALKGKIASTPYAAGWREFATPDMLGEQVVSDYLHKLSPSIAGLIRCGEDQRLSSGEFWMLAMDCGTNNSTTASRGGLPVAQVILNDATVVHSDWAGVPTNSSAPNTAALIVAYLDTAEGQAWLWKYNADDLYTFPDSKSAPLVKQVRTSGGKVLVDSPQWLNSVPSFLKTQQALQNILAKK
jgi:ABC-type Fe3+ transport system substrate-binding protein